MTGTDLGINRPRTIAPRSGLGDFLADRWRPGCLRRIPRRFSRPSIRATSAPFETRSPFVTSGIRIGTPAITTRGFKEAESRELAGWICDVLDDINNAAAIERVKQQVLEICQRFPVYGK